MATTTKICTTKKVFIFKDETGLEVIIYDFREGIASIRLLIGNGGVKLVNFILGSFSIGSNFYKTLCKVYNLSEETPFLGVEIEICGVRRVILRKSADKESIEKEFMSIEYEIASRAMNEIATKFANYMNQIASISRDTVGVQLRFRNEAAKKKWERLREQTIKQDNEQRWQYVEYGNCLALLIEKAMVCENKTFDEAAEEAIERMRSIDNIEDDVDRLDVEAQGIHMISQYWDKGQLLEKWYNRKLYDEFKSDIDEL